MIEEGERRWRAAPLAGLEALSCAIVEGGEDDEGRLARQLVENCCREGLMPIEQARSFDRLMKARKCSAAKVAELVGLSRSSVTRALALLDLAGEVLEHVEAGTIAPSVAYEISKLDDPAGQIAAAGRILEADLTRDEAIEEVRRAGGKAKAKGIEPPPRAGGLPDWRDRAATAAGFPSGVVKLLVDSGIETLGEAWGLLESGWLMEGLNWSYSEVKRLEASLVELRRAEGDPDPFLHPMPKPPGPAPGEGRGVPPSLARPARAEPAGKLAGPFSLTWGKQASTDADEAAIGRAGCLDLVVRSSGGERPLREVLILLREAVARVEEMVGPRPDGKT